MNILRTYDKLIATIPARRSKDPLRPGSGRTSSTSSHQHLR